ncbi:MAG: translation initiation factor IF-2 subunit gamma [Candidatus Micrarchaeia archaeon]
MAQAEVNIGMLGHVDHGKTALTHALTGVWTDTHSEEIKRGITIKLGYADAVFRKCPKCGEPQAFTTKEKCPKCGSATDVLRRVSFIDSPGHETLMTTAIAASSVMDGALLVIAANEPCPQPQTLEHLMVLDILGVKNVIVIQNKIDLVSREKALENYNQIKKFLSGTVAENAPVIPVAANYFANLDLVIQAIEKHIPTPKRDAGAPFRMYVARSFDVNKPGTDIDKLVGGVVGGSIIQGTVRVGDEIELRPGISRGAEKEGREPSHEPIVTRVESLSVGSERLEEARPGGLVAIGTRLDPALTKADSLVGNLVGKPGTLPELVSEAELDFVLLKRVDLENPPLRQNEPLVLSVGTTTAIGFVDKIKKNILSLKLKRPICAKKGSKVALSRRLGQRWHLAGYGTLR